MLRALALIAVLVAPATADVSEPTPTTPLPALPVMPAHPAVAPRRPTVFELFVGISASLGGTPAGSLGVRALRSDWSAELGFELALPESHAMVDVSRGGAALAVCRYFGPLALCPIANAGWIHGSGNGAAMVETSTAPLIAVGARLAAELQITRRFALRVRGEGRILLTSTAFAIDGATAWETSRGEGWLGIDLLARISR